MHRLGPIMRHMRLITGMAQVTGIDLTDARARGDLSGADWADMVLACRDCDWAGRCGDWLDRQRGPIGRGPVGQGPIHAPETCCNRARLAALKAMAALDHA